MGNYGNNTAAANREIMGKNDNNIVRFTKLYFLALVIMTIAEFIGPANFNVGPGKVILLPVSYTHLDVYKRQQPHRGGTPFVINPKTILGVNRRGPLRIQRLFQREPRDPVIRRIGVGAAAVPIGQENT